MDFNPKSGTLRHKQTPEVLPASQYLQDRLQERRARNTRPKRTRQSDFGPRMTAGHDDDLFFAEAEDGRQALERSYDSSPLAPISRYASDNVNSSSGSGTLSAGGRKRRMPGARELDEQMDRLTKQNFDLKLELDHRRESQAKLHAEIEAMRATVERAERLEEEHEELMRINSLLVDELEKRDRAIREAADIICELEEKVEDFEETRPGTAQADSGYAGTEVQDQMLLSSPQEIANDPTVPRQAPAAATLASSKLNTAVQAPTPTKSRREPAFLTSQKPSTTALRSVYLDAGRNLHPVKSFNSILSRHASTIDENALADEVLNSPRLSALSESSFPSIYGKKSETPEKYDWEDLPESSRPYASAHSRQDSITRVSQWIEERQLMSGTPSKSDSILSPEVAATTFPTPHVLRRSAENSIQSLSSAAASARSDLLETSTSIKPFPTLGNRIKHAPKPSASTSTPAFEDAILPPTPESVNTRTFVPSRSNFSERSVLDPTSANARSFTPLPPRPSTSGHDHIHAFSSQAAMEDMSGESDDEYYEARSNTLQDGSDYDGYPDGNSITNGTPSRFLKHGKQLSVATDMFFNSSDLSPQTGVHAAQRRKSSSEVASTPYRKPGFHRADTSPNYGFISRRMNSSHGRPATSDSTMSPYSYNSASTSGHTATYNRYSRSLSPEPSPYSSQSIAATIATSPSPPKFQPHSSPASRSSFSQKTHKLFRRLSNTASNHNGDEPRPTPRREREVSPLPTLTSTHSSAYQMPHPERREIRRPNTSASMRPTPARAVSRDASWSRPTISPRTMTDPNFSPPSQSAGSFGQPDSSAPALKRALFRRGGSIKQADVSSVRSLRR
jgi:hypothetical protein